MRPITGKRVQFDEEETMTEDGFIIDSFTMILDAIEEGEIKENDS